MEKIAISIEEASEYCGVSRSSLYNLFRDGSIKPRKIGRKTLILVDDLKAFIESLPVAEI